jgi:hypothetical protein
MKSMNWENRMIRVMIGDEQKGVEVGRLLTRLDYHHHHFLHPPIRISLA